MSSAPMSSVPSYTTATITTTSNNNNNNNNNNISVPNMKQEILHDDLDFNENQSVDGPDLKRQFDKEISQPLQNNEQQQDEDQRQRLLLEDDEIEMEDDEEDEDEEVMQQNNQQQSYVDDASDLYANDADQFSNSDRESNLPLTEDYNNVPDHNQVSHPSDPFVDKDGIWTLPIDKNYCTLEEIRRGQVINKKPPNECPVFNCDKKINEKRAEPSPGTISSGLRTHVLFVHYGRPKLNKKRKLGWTPAKRRNQLSPKKHIETSSSHSSPSTSKQDYDTSLINHSTSNIQASLNLIQRGMTNPRLSTKSLLSKKSKIPTPKATLLNPLQMSQSLQSLMQATGNVGIQPQQQKLKSHDTNQMQKNFNTTTSSLFSILAGLTQQPNQTQSPSTSKKTPPPTTTINISQCSRNLPSNTRQPVNSSLLSLLNEKISGNVATSLQQQLKKSMNVDSAAKNASSTLRQNLPNTANSYYHTNNESNYNNSSSILSNLCSGNGDSRSTYDNSMPLNQFIESIAAKSGSNIGSSGIAEAKKIIEKFTTSLICSSQTIADHYITQYATDAPQQKPEISPSDILLAYKMMHKSHGQP